MVVQTDGTRRRRPSDSGNLSRSIFLFEHDLFGKPVPTPHQVRGRLFPDHALEDRLSDGDLAAGSENDYFTVGIFFGQNRQVGGESRDVLWPKIANTDDVRAD